MSKRYDVDRAPYNIFFECYGKKMHNILYILIFIIIAIIYCSRVVVEWIALHVKSKNHMRLKWKKKLSFF